MQKRQHQPGFKAKVALEALKEIKTMSELSSQFQLHPTQIRRWRDRLREELPNVFLNGLNKEIKKKDELIEELYKQVGQLSVELDWLKKKLVIIGQ